MACMIKEIPEDFIVEEVFKTDAKSPGHYYYHTVKKKNLSTIQAIELISKRFNIKKKHIGYAGIKDKKAITTQTISIKNKKISLNLSNLIIEFFGSYSEPVSLGDLEGNNFRITLRKCHSLKAISKFPNYFGEQRFSEGNIEIGRDIIKKNFKNAVEGIIAKDIFFKKKALQYLKKNNKDYVGALKLLNFKVIKLYIHSYQSSLWNKTLDLAIRNNIKSKQLPIIGYGTELRGPLKNIIEGLLAKESLKLRDFIIPQIPELSSAGDMRDAFKEMRNLSINIADDELYKGHKKAVLRFFLDKGSYATEAIKYLLSIS